MIPQPVSGQVTITVTFNLAATASEDSSAPAVQNILHGNFPNPFNPETTIRYSLKEASSVSVQVFNVKGELVRTLVDAIQPAGHHSVVWDGLDNSGKPVSSGLYFYRLSTPSFQQTRKMLLMK